MRPWPRAIWVIRDDDGACRFTVLGEPATLSGAAAGGGNVLEAALAAASSKEALNLNEKSAVEFREC